MGDRVLVRHGAQLWPQQYLPVNTARQYADYMDAKTFGERVKAARGAAGLTQVQLAAKAGIGQSAISSIEGGSSKWTRGANLLRLAAALDVDPDWLETGKGSQRSNTGPTYQQFAAVLSELSPDNRRRLLGLARSLLADQAKPSIANAYPAAPKPVVKIGQKAS